MDDQFENKGKDQNVAQGDGAIGKQVNNSRSTTQTIEGNENITAGRDVNITNNNHPTAPPIIPRQLPSLDDCFLGRDKDLTNLIDQLYPGKVAAVCGPGGMGKSALAAQAVHKLEKDRFPDGIVFHSFYGHPETEQALQTICAAFQVEAKAGLETTVKGLLANRKSLLILDGAEEADDLKAVLDLRSTCGVLITSRKRDDAQGFRLDLVPLEDEPAAEVLREHSGLAADDIAVQGICIILDGWPVGLRIAGRYLSSTSESAADYLRWLEQEPFKELGDGEHQEENAALLLRRSVAQVSKDAKRTLGLGGILAFASISREQVAAMLEGDERRGRLALNELVNYGLMLPSEDRWQVSHALIHTYARTKLALNKGSLEQFARSYAVFCRKQSKNGIKGYTRLDQERAHCLKLMDSCLKKGLWQMVQALVEAIDVYLERQGYWTEELTAFEMALTAVQQSGDRKNEGVYLNNLGYTCDRCGEWEKALAYYQQCLLIYQELRAKKAESTTLNNIATIYQQQGKYKDALQYYKKSLGICWEIGDQKGTDITMNNIGMLDYAQGHYETALSYLEQCLPSTGKAENRSGEGTTLNNIGLIYDAQDKPRKAIEYYEQALLIYQKLGDRPGKSLAYWNIGLTYRTLDDLAQAEYYISLAVQIAEDIDLPELEKYRDGLKQMRAARRWA